MDGPGPNDGGRIEKVFVSHAHEDADWVRTQLIPALKARGLQVWEMSMIRGGEEFEREIKEALDWCDTLLVVVSKHSGEAKWVRSEIGGAMDRNRRIVPIRVDATRPSDVYVALGGLQHVDVAGSQELPVALDRLIRGGSTPGTGSRRSTRRGWIAAAAALLVGAVAYLVVQGSGPGVPAPNRAKAIALRLQGEVSSTCTSLVLMGDGDRWEQGSVDAYAWDGGARQDSFRPTTEVRDGKELRVEPHPEKRTRPWTVRFTITLVSNDLVRGIVPIKVGVCNADREYLGPGSAVVEVAQIVYDDGTRSPEIRIPKEQAKFAIDVKMENHTHKLTLPQELLDRVKDAGSR